MVERKNRQTGELFWGCQQYPKCKDRSWMREDTSGEMPGDYISSDEVDQDMDLYDALTDGRYFGDQ